MSFTSGTPLLVPPNGQPISPSLQLPQPAVGPVEAQLNFVVTIAGLSDNAFDSGSARRDLRH